MTGIKNELPSNKFPNVFNRAIQSDKKLIQAHTCYWDNEEVARIIRDEIF